MSKYINISKDAINPQWNNITHAVADRVFGKKKSREYDDIVVDFQNALEYHAGWASTPGESIDPIYTRGEMDAIRHYYGPKLMAEEAGFLSSAAMSFGHELQVMQKWSEGGKEDFMNNYTSLYDYWKEKGPSGKDFYELMRGGEHMDVDTFKEYANYALDKAMIPEEDY